MMDSREESWARAVLEKLALETLAEQKRRRRWGVFFKLVSLTFLGVIFWSFGDFGSAEPLDGGKHTALVSLEGDRKSVV